MINSSQFHAISENVTDLYNNLFHFRFDDYPCYVDWSFLSPSGVTKSHHQTGLRCIVYICNNVTRTTKQQTINIIFVPIRVYFRYNISAVNRLYRPFDSAAGNN